MKATPASTPILVVLGGLPGVGKSTIAHALLERWPAVYLRIDSIEQALRDARVLVAGQVGAAGYMAAYALARDQLLRGMSVLADCVNPLPVTREAWRAVARGAPALVVEVEVSAAILRWRVMGDVTGLLEPKPGNMEAAPDVRRMSG